MSPLTQEISQPTKRTVQGGRPSILTRARALIHFAAAISFVLSVSLWFAGNHDEGLFVGIWVPSIISLGAFLVPRRAAS